MPDAQVGTVEAGFDNVHDDSFNIGEIGISVPVSDGLVGGRPYETKWGWIILAAAIGNGLNRLVFV